MGNVVAVPERVLIALDGLFGEGVRIVEVIEHSFYARLHGHAIATTRRRRIYLCDGAESFFKDPALILHEYFHVMNQWEPGLLTIGRYILEWLQHGYWNNRFEVEARQFTADNLDSFKTIIARPNA
jgi:hypothetical protein